MNKRMLEKHVQALFCPLFHYMLTILNNFAAIVANSHSIPKNTFYTKQIYAATEDL